MRELLTHHGAADLVTATTSGLTATLLPFVYDPTVGKHGALLGHLARSNDQWRQQVIGQALVIVRGPDAYVSPSWYASKGEHGRVVPTWNYVTAHVYGQLVIHDDPDWVELLVRRLTDRHEADTPRPCRSTTPPRPSSPDSCARSSGSSWSSAAWTPRPSSARTGRPPDIYGVIAGLVARGDRTTADAVRGNRA